MGGIGNLYVAQHQINDLEVNIMKISTREWELQRKKLYGYALGIAVVAMTLLVIVMIAY